MMKRFDIHFFHTGALVIPGLKAENKTEARKKARKRLPKKYRNEEIDIRPASER